MNAAETIQRVKLLLGKNHRELTQAESDWLINVLSIVDESIIDLPDIDPNSFQEGSPNQELLNSILHETERQGVPNLLVQQVKTQINTGSRTSLDEVVADLRTRQSFYGQLIRNAQRNLAQRTKKNLAPNPTPETIHNATAVTVSEIITPAVTGGDTDKYASTHDGVTPLQAIRNTRTTLYQELAASVAKQLGVYFTPELVDEVTAIAAITDLTNPREMAALIAAVDKPPTPEQNQAIIEKAAEINPSDYYLQKETTKVTLDESPKDLPLTDAGKYADSANQVASAVRTLDDQAHQITDAEKTLTLPHDQASKLVLSREYKYTPEQLERMSAVVIEAAANPGTSMSPALGSSFRQEVNRNVHNQVDRHGTHPQIGDIARGILRDKRSNALPHVADIEKSPKFADLAKQFPNLSKQLSQNWERLSQLGYISPGRVSGLFNPTTAISSRVQGWIGQKLSSGLLKLSEKVASKAIKQVLQTFAKEGIKKGLVAAALLLNVAIPGLSLIVAAVVHIAPKVINKLMQPINALFGNKNTKETVKDIGRGAVGGAFFLAGLPMFIAASAFPLLISPTIVAGVVAGYLLFFIPVINMGTIISTMAQLESATAPFSGGNTPYTGAVIAGCHSITPVSHGSIIQGPHGRMSHSQIEAIDIYVPIGTPVYSVASGTVTAARYYGVYGNMITIRSSIDSKTYSVTYGHLATIGVSTGQAVNVGDQIGLSGQTSSEPGYRNPHLHLEYTGLIYNQCPAGGIKVPEGCHVNPAEYCSSCTACGTIKW